MTLLNVLQDKLSGKNIKIVLPEGEDERVLTAATQLHKTDYVSPILLGNKEKVQALADDKGLDISDIFGDCAINPTLEAPDLAEIAVESAKSAKSFGMEPRIAMLSFSTKGSAKSDDVEKVSTAVQMAQEKIASEQMDDVVIDGEFQFDAAIMPEVAKKKAPDAKLQGDANVFVFPSLEAGNIGYKIAQRLGGYDAVGPVLQGLNSPVNDLSRGCSTEDVYNLSIITAAQALQ